MSTAKTTMHPAATYQRDRCLTPKLRLDNPIRSLWLPLARKASNEAHDSREDGGGDAKGGLSDRSTFPAAPSIFGPSAGGVSACG